MGRRSPRGLPFTLVTAILVALPAMTAAAAPSTVGLWHMDETSGSTMSDASGKGNNGQLSNITFVSPGYNGSGGAYSFNGTSSRVLIPDSASLNPGSQNISITVHVKTNGSTLAQQGDYDVVRKDRAGQSYKMEIFGTGQAYCHFKGTVSQKSLKKGPNLTDNRWHTIKCAKTANQISLTVDGTMWTTNVTIGSISNSIYLLLGAKPNGGDRFAGQLDEVSIRIG